MSKQRAGGLGRGLDAIFHANPKVDEPVNEVPIADLRPNPYQPRRVFDEEKLEDLAASIREHGVIQPIIVRAAVRGYEIVAGERRWRAAKSAGLTQVPVVVRSFSDLQMSEIASFASGSLSRLSHAAKRLEQQGFLTRTQIPGQGRRTNAILTDAGYRKVVETAPGHVAEVRRLLIDAVSASDLAALTRIGAAVVERIGEECPSGGGFDGRDA